MSAAFIDRFISFLYYVYKTQFNAQMKVKEIMKETTINTVPIWEKLNLTINEAAEYSNIGINRLTELVSNPMCPFVLHVGKKRLIKRKEFERYIEKNLEV